MNTNQITKKRILVVLTGGTICSKFSEKEENVKVNSNETGLILEQSFNNSYSSFANKVEFKLTDYYEIFSENMTISKWNRLLHDFRNMPGFYNTAKKCGNYPSLVRADKNDIDAENVFDGIIIAHGTDSLAYSSAMFSLLLNNIGVPVFIVASNEALSSDKANGTDNFISAVECICMGIKPNVYITYKNISDKKMYLHYASRIKQCINYQEDFFSTGMVDISGISDVNSIQYFKKLPRSHIDYRCKDDENNDFIIDLFENDWKINNSILLIEPYVGLNYDFFNFSENVEAILHGTYHSGTVCSEDNEKNNGYDYDDYCNSILYLIDKVGNKKIYIAPSDLSGNIYETIKKIKEHQNGNVYFVNGVTKEMLYAKLLVAFSYEPLKRKITHFLSSEYNHEIVVEINGSQKLIDRVD